MLVAVDIETTGLGAHSEPPREDAIIEIGIAWRAPGSPLIQEAGTLVWPGEKWFENGRADGALAINHLSVDELRQSEVGPDCAVDRLCAALWNDMWESGITWKDKITWLAYRSSFEESFLSKEPWSRLFSHGTWTCVMEASKRAMGRTDRLHLWEAAEFFGLVNPQAHRAMSDAVTTLQLYERIQERMGNLTAGFVEGMP